MTRRHRRQRRPEHVAYRFTPLGIERLRADLETADGRAVAEDVLRAGGTDPDDETALRARGSLLATLYADARYGPP